VYVRKCKQINLLPLSARFDLNDLLFLHKIIYELKPVNLPSYLSFFNGQSRLRSCHLDNLSLVSSIHPISTQCTTRTSNPLANTFFYRTHSKWNSLPISLREIRCPDLFKSMLKGHLWKSLVMPDDAEISFLTDDED
jgi:hypothetical protein